MSLHNQPLFVSAIRDYGPSLVNISTMFTDNETEQKALYQRIVLSIWQALAHYMQNKQDGQDKQAVDLCIFIYQVAFNCAYVRMTKHKKVAHTDLLLPTESLLQKTPPILRVMREMPFVHRQLLCLLFDEFSHEDISVICGIDIAKIPASLAIAQQVFKQKMTFLEQSGEVVNV